VSECEPAVRSSAGLDVSLTCTAASYYTAEKAGVFRMSETDGQRLVQLHPAQLSMLRPQQPRLATIPGRDEKHVILGLSVFDRLRLPEDGNLLKGPCPDA
jgi:hypothetical protein